jgi:hypothetical protein
MAGTPTLKSHERHLRRADGADELDRPPREEHDMTTTQPTTADADVPPYDPGEGIGISSRVFRTTDTRRYDK